MDQQPAYYLALVLNALSQKFEKWQELGDEVNLYLESFSKISYIPLLSLLEVSDGKLLSSIVLESENI